MPWSTPSFFIFSVQVLWSLQIDSIAKLRFPLWWQFSNHWAFLPVLPAKEQWVLIKTLLKRFPFTSAFEAFRGQTGEGCLVLFMHMQALSELGGWLWVEKTVQKPGAYRRGLDFNLMRLVKRLDWRGSSCIFFPKFEAYFKIGLAFLSFASTEMFVSLSSRIKVSSFKVQG